MTNEELQSKLSELNTQANTARSTGDRDLYDDLVDQMIDLENAYLDAGGELPPPAYRS